MTPILTIRLEKIQHKPKTSDNAPCTDNLKNMKTHKSRTPENPNEFIESEVTLDDDSPEKKVVERSGCAKHHYNLRKCVATYGDWVKCQDLVKIFKDCIVKERKRKGGTYSDFYLDMGTAAGGK